MSDEREQVATLLDAAADDLELAVQHLRTAARHFRDGEVPRGCAHAFAAEGHVRAANDPIAEASRRHAKRADPNARAPS